MFKPFKVKKYLHGSYEDNWNVISKAEKKGCRDSHDLKYLGSEVCFEVEIDEDSNNRVLKINGIDVSDKNISI